MKSGRIGAKKKAHQLAKYLRAERPDYAYLKQVFRELRAILEIPVPHPSQRLPDVPSDEEIRRYYEVVWQTRNFQDMVLVKTLLYTGVRVSELVNIRLTEVDVERCQIRINQGKGGKDRIVPFPTTFKEVLAMHIERMREKHAVYLFESNRKHKYTDRGVRKLLSRYAEAAGLQRAISPHKFRHYLLTWLKKQGIDDALIQPYSGHASRESLEVYSRLAIAEAQEQYNQVIGQFPI